MFHASRGTFQSRAVQFPVRRKMRARNACAAYSGRTNCKRRQEEHPDKLDSSRNAKDVTDRVQLVAEIKVCGSSVLLCIADKSPPDIPAMPRLRNSRTGVRTSL